MTRKWCNKNLGSKPNDVGLFLSFSDQFRHLLLLNRFANQLEAKFCVMPPWVGGQNFSLNFSFLYYSNICT